MALLGYQSWKADKVESGECRQTIRARRKHRVKVGDTLYHYRGLRTKATRKILESVCTETFPLRAIGFGEEQRWAWMDVSLSELEKIAERDGFKDVLAMTVWFKHNHKMKNGVAEFDVIRW